MRKLRSFLPVLDIAACTEGTAPVSTVGPGVERQVAQVLLTLAHYQEAFWADSLTYSLALPAAEQWTTYYRGVPPPLGVHVRVLEADSSGWQAAVELFNNLFTGLGIITSDWVILKIGSFKASTRKVSTNTPYFIDR